MIASAQNYQHRLSGYAQVQGTRPQAVAYALSDSPLGQAAWIYSKNAKPRLFVRKHLVTETSDKTRPW